MKRHLKKFFIPHKENNYHPHILHTKRAILYSAVFVLLKVFVIIFVALLPAQVFVLPDVLAEEQRQIIELTNDLRKKQGKSPLVESKILDISSQYKSDDMAEKEYFSHTSGNKSLSYWLKTAGYEYVSAGENLAVGFNGAGDIVTAWVNSPTHYSNLIDSEFKEFGVGLSGGVFDGQPTVYIAQHFGLPKEKLAPKKVEAEKKPAATNEPKKLKISPKNEPAGKIIEVAATSSESAVLSEKVVVNEVTSTPLIGNIKQNPIDQYIQAKKVLSPITSIFAVSRVIFLSAAIFFAIALALKIFIEIEHQHHHITLQTLGLVGLLLFLWRF